MENPLHCTCHHFCASFVKEIMLPFSKFKSRLKTQPIICKFLITSARGRRSTKDTEAYDVNNVCSMSIVDKVHVSFAASSQMHSVQPVMPKPLV